MHDMNVSMTMGAIIAAGFWVAVIVLLVVHTVTGSLTFGLWGLATSAGAATATIRAYLIRLEEHERNAFELGRDWGSATRIERR